MKLNNTRKPFKLQQNIIMLFAAIVLLGLFSLVNPNIIKDKYMILSMVQQAAELICFQELISEVPLKYTVALWKMNVQRYLQMLSIQVDSTLYIKNRDCKTATV